MLSAGSETSVYRTQATQRAREPEERERAIARLAGRQHGVLSLQQLRTLGLTSSAVRSRVRSGRLHRLYRGVYSVGHERLPPNGHRMAAVLACGDGAVLSHRTAAALHGLRPSSSTSFDLTAPARRGRHIDGLTVHRPTGLTPTDLTVEQRIPTTTVARTLLDLATLVTVDQLARAVDRAEQLGSFDLAAVQNVLDRAGARQGTARLRAAIADHSTRPPTRSELETAFLSLAAESDLPRPAVNSLLDTPGGSLEVDFSWPERRLAVETDGHETHRTRLAFERDRHRDQLLALAGWRVIRFTWRQIAADPERVSATLGALLDRPVPRPAR